MSDLTFTSTPNPNAGQQARPVVFDVDGREYTFRAPQTNGMMMALMKRSRSEWDQVQHMQEMWAWFSAGLDPDHEPVVGVEYVKDDSRDWDDPEGPDEDDPAVTTGHDERGIRVETCQVCQLRDRLDDPADPFDVKTMQKVMLGLFGKASGDRPPTSPNGSPRKPRPRGR